MATSISLRLRGALEWTRGPSWTARAIGGSIWAIAGSASSQVVRLGGNLVLSRLLFPDAFGLMVLVNTIMQGLRMFSDLGIGPSVIRDPRGEDPAFLRTAWTLQAARGLAIGLVTLAISWPAARFYQDARLLSFIPAAGLQAALTGLNSPALFVLERRLDLRRRVLIDLCGQFLGVAGMISWALLRPTPWALIGGGFVETAFLIVVSHRLAPRIERKFRIERSSARDVLRFGRWVFLATVFSFCANRADRLVLAKAFPSKELLGVYSFAIVWAGFVLETVRDLSGRILFPLYSRWSDEGLAGLRRRVLRARVTLGALFVPPLLLLSAAGPWLLRLLYDQRYRDAGPMLQLLAAGSIAGCATTSLDSSLLAVGDSLRYMIWQGGRFAITLACMLIGLHVSGSMGLVCGVAWSNLAVFPLLALLAWPHGLAMPLLDFAFVGISAGALLILR